MRAIALAAALLAGCAAQPSGDGKARYGQPVSGPGALRADYNPQDVPFNAQTLAAAFRSVAFRAAAMATDDGGAEYDVPDRLTRWEKPVRWRLDGDDVTEADRAELERLRDRISTLVGRDFLQIASLRPTLQVGFLNPASRRTVAAKTAPNSNAALALDALQGGGRNCVFLSYVNNGDSSVARAQVLIRSEAAGMARRNCLHEGMLHSLGLRSSSPDARPSVLNQDREFALMTYHDELLLRILYDPRLKTGMTEDEAMPIVHEIIAEFDLFDRVHAVDARKKGP